MPIPGTNLAPMLDGEGPTPEADLARLRDQRVNTKLPERVRVPSTSRSEEPRILLIHVPKTGGTSLRSMVERHVPPEKTFLSTGEHQWTERSLRDLLEIRLFAGHNFLEPLYLFPDDTWITALSVREPASLWRSRYKSVRRNTRAAGRDAPVLHMSMDEWVASQTDTALSNPQASWLLHRMRIMFDSRISPEGHMNGTASRLRLNGELLANLLDSLLDAVTIVGVTEDLQSIYVDLCDALGWTPEFEVPLRENLSREPEAMLVLSPEQEERLSRLNRLDEYLHQGALKRSRRRHDDQVLRSAVEAPFSDSSGPSELSQLRRELDVERARYERLRSRKVVRLGLAAARLARPAIVALRRPPLDTPSGES